MVNLKEGWFWDCVRIVLIARVVVYVVVWEFSVLGRPVTPFMTTLAFPSSPKGRKTNANRYLETPP